VKKLALAAAGVFAITSFVGLTASTATAGAACGSRAPSDHDGSSHPTAGETRGVRNGAGTSCAIIGAYKSGDKLDYYCYTVNGSTGLTWTYLRDDSNHAVAGWVQDSYLPGLGSSVKCP
jgi:hypothetical protein